jgi:hypothetical protein
MSNFHGNYYQLCFSDNELIKKLMNIKWNIDTHTCNYSIHNFKINKFKFDDYKFKFEFELNNYISLHKSLQIKFDNSIPCMSCSTVSHEKFIKLSGIGLLMYDCVYQPDVIYYNNLTKTINIPFYEHTNVNNTIFIFARNMNINIKLNEEWKLFSSNISNINNDKSFILANYIYKHSQLSINDLHENNIYIKFLNLYNILVSKNKQIPFDLLLIILQKMYANFCPNNIISLQGEGFMYDHSPHGVLLQLQHSYKVISQYYEYSHLIPNNIESTQNIIKINSADFSNDKQIFKGNSVALLICCFNKNDCIVDAIDKYELTINDNMLKQGNWSDLYINNKIQYKLNLPQPQNFQAQGVGAIFFGTQGLNIISIVNSLMNFNRVDTTTLTLTIKPEYIKEISKIHILNQCLDTFRDPKF